MAAMVSTHTTPLIVRNDTSSLAERWSGSGIWTADNTPNMHIKKIVAERPRFLNLHRSTPATPHTTARIKMAISNAKPMISSSSICGSLVQSRKMERNTCTPPASNNAAKRTFDTARIDTPNGRFFVIMAASLGSYASSANPCSTLRIVTSGQFCTLQRVRNAINSHQ